MSITLKRGMVWRGLVLAWLVVLGASPALVLACEKSLRWEDDPPFSMADPAGEIVGIDVDLNRAALERLGCRVKLVKLPWARALKELELGRLDILPGAFPTPERQAFAYFSGPVLKPSRNVLFMHVDALDRWPVQSLQELRDTDFRLGAQINVSYGRDYQELMSAPAFASRVSFSPNRTNLWRMIERRRIDGLIADEKTGIYEIRKLGLGDAIKLTPVVVSAESAEVAFSRKSNPPEFVEDYAQVLKSMVADGQYQRIVQAYLRE